MLSCCAPHDHARVAAWRNGDADNPARGLRVRLQASKGQGGKETMTALPEACVSASKLQSARANG
eukprot:12646968-Alexandrium_andersonii.AAC.1